ncbi:C-factor [Astyanax mexicanus]|uniref:C-factor n=1 Tax=Astyanax mexicanus TaxID=7994 RepID=UPI0020CAFC8F|nr:C-factor [Astyanax mexicanus]
MAAVALVQGASRGLGLEFCRHLMQHRAPAAVIATCRDPDTAPALAALSGEYPDRLAVMRVDITREEQVRSAAERLSSTFPKLDLLINCAAVLHPSGRGETSLRDVSAQGITATLATNTVGPLLMAKYFSPLLKKGTGAFGQQPEDKAKQHSGVLVNMSARVGSIGDNALGGWYSYRMSKAALNMATRNLSIELGRSQPKIVCVSLHPGTVNTDLSRPYHKNVPQHKLFSTQYSVQCLMDIIDSLSMDKSGKAYAWDGSEIPW